MSEKSFMQHDVENKQLKEENGNEKVETRNEKVETINKKREITNENEQFKKKNIVKDANTTKLIEEPKEIKSPNWVDKN